MGTPLLDRIKEGKQRHEPPKVTQLVPVKMSPFVRALNEKRLPAKALWNGAWTPDGDGGAA